MDNPYEIRVNTLIDLTSCVQEPIHLTGAIQPFGFLICLAEKTMRVVLASENIADYTGISANQVLQKGLYLSEIGFGIF